VEKSTLLKIVSDNLFQRRVSVNPTTVSTLHWCERKKLLHWRRNISQMSYLYRVWINTTKALTAIPQWPYHA